MCTNFISVPMQEQHRSLNIHYYLECEEMVKDHMFVLTIMLLEPNIYIFK